MGLIRSIFNWAREDLTRQAYAAPAPAVKPPIHELQRVDIVGESNYQRELHALAGDPQRTEHGVSVWVCADLVPEPGNPYDKNAVACRVDGVTVGYLSRAQAVAYHAMLKKLGRPRHEPIVDIEAEIRGGFRGDGFNASYGLALYMAPTVAALLNA